MTSVAVRPTLPITRNQEATVYVGNLDERVNESLLWELMVQAGPVVHVHIPRDRINQTHQGYGFVEFQSEEDADYAVKVMNQIRLFTKPIRVNKATADKKDLDVGANLFIGNLAPEIDEKLLQDTFGSFGILVQNPKIARELDSGAPKGYGFVSYDCFEAADAAIEAMNGQFLCNRPVTVSFAFKKDGKGERHGSASERLLAQQAKKSALGGTQQTPPATPAASIPAAPSSVSPVGYMGYYQGYPPMQPNGQVYAYPPQQGFAPPTGYPIMNPMGFAQPPPGYPSVPMGYPPQPGYPYYPQNMPLDPSNMMPSYPPSPAGYPPYFHTSPPPSTQ